MFGSMPSECGNSNIVSTVWTKFSFLHTRGGHTPFHLQSKYKTNGYILAGYVTTINLCADFQEAKLTRALFTLIILTSKHLNARFVVYFDSLHLNYPKHCMDPVFDHKLLKQKVHLYYPVLFLWPFIWQLHWLGFEPATLWTWRRAAWWVSKSAVLPSRPQVSCY